MPSAVNITAILAGVDVKRDVIGRIQRTLWAAFVTHRHEDTIRIISVRRARPDDKAQYLQERG